MALSAAPQDGIDNQWPGMKVPDDQVTPELLALWHVRNELRLAVAAQQRVAEALEQSHKDVARLRAATQVAELAAKQAFYAIEAADAAAAEKTADAATTQDPRGKNRK